MQLSHTGHPVMVHWWWVAPPCWFTLARIKRDLLALPVRGRNYPNKQSVVRHLVIWSHILIKCWPSCVSYCELWINSFFPNFMASVCFFLAKFLWCNNNQSGNHPQKKSIAKIWLYNNRYEFSLFSKGSYYISLIAYWKLS